MAMQPTDIQVERTLAALEVTPASPPRPSIPRDTLEIVLRDLPDGLLDDLGDSPAVRPERLAEARTRMAEGELSSDELANRIVGRLVCDRLR
jgi:hypothetical protein